MNRAFSASFAREAAGRDYPFEHAHASVGMAPGGPPPLPSAGMGHPRVPTPFPSALPRLGAFVLFLKQIRGQFSQAAALALDERDVGGQGLGSKTVHQVIESVAVGVYIRVVDSIWVSREYDLGVLADAGDDGIDLERCEVLGLVDDHETIGDASASESMTWSVS